MLHLLSLFCAVSRGHDSAHAAYFQLQKELFSLSLMATQSQEASLQHIDWLSQIRAELHEPINGSDSSGPAGNLRSNHSARVRSPSRSASRSVSLLPHRPLFGAAVSRPLITVMRHVMFKGRANI